MRLRTWIGRLTFGLLVAALGAGHVQAQVATAGGAVIQGVYVDAEGVLRTVVVGDETDRLEKLRRRAARPMATSAVASKSPLRKVSLVRLARAMRDRAQAGQPVSDEMRFLAGVLQIRHLFVYPEQGDLVIVGPAEGWVVNRAGRVVGRSTGRPVVQLDDLLVALRIFSAGMDAPPLVGCSINHTPEGIRQLRQFIASLGRSISRRRVNRALLEGVRNALGLQTVALFGLPPDCRLAMVLVEADYRMKLIGIGLENPRVRGIKSYISLLRPGSGGMKTLQRWWFVPEYTAIVEGADGNAFAFQGPRVKLLAADDLIQVSGEVQRRDTADRINRRFVFGFSKHYEELARVNPIFAELQNVIDVLIVAALIQQREFHTAAGPDLAFLYDPQGYQPEPVVTPKQVVSAVNYRWIGNRLALPVGGGVGVRASEVLSRHTKQGSDSAKLLEQQRNVEFASAERWWWD